MNLIRSLWNPEQNVQRLESPGPTRPELPGIDTLIAKNPFTFFFDPDKADEYIDMLNSVIKSAGGEEINAYPGFYIANSDNIKRWNAFVETLKTQSANGILNLGAIGIKRGPQWLVKTDVSSAADPVMYEYYIGRRLNKLRKYVPNFSLTYAGFQCSVNLYQRPDNAKFKRIEEWCTPPSQQGRLYDKRVPKQFIVSELVKPATQLFKYAQKASGEDVAVALIQILCALEFAQREEAFTHYDLHSENVLMQELDESETVFLYNLGDTVVAVPAVARWVIIDFGRSHIKNAPKNVRDMWPFDRFFDNLGIRPWQPNQMWDMTRLFYHTMTANRDPRLQRVRQMFEDDLKINGCSVDQQGYLSRMCNSKINSPQKLASLIAKAFGAEIKDKVSKATNFVWYGYEVSEDAKSTFEQQIRSGMAIQQTNRPHKTIVEPHRQQVVLNELEALRKRRKEEEAVAEFAKRRAEEAQQRKKEADIRAAKEAEVRQRIIRDMKAQPLVMQPPKIPLQPPKVSQPLPPMVPIIKIGIEDKTNKLNEAFEKSLKRRQEAAKIRQLDVKTFKEFVASEKDAIRQQVLDSENIEPMDSENIEPMELSSYQSQMDISPEDLNDVEQMELSSLMRGGGDSGTTCLYVDGRLLQREEIESTLQQLDKWEPDFQYLDDSQLCNALLDTISGN